MPPRKLYFENVRVGDEIPAMAKSPVDRVQLAKHAGATGDFNPIHVDENYARGVGLPSVYAPSVLGMGFLGQLITDWARGAQLKKFHNRFIKMLWPGDTLVCKGRVADREGHAGKYLLELDVWAENQKGELVLRGGATLQVFYSAEDENRAKNGQGPVIVEVPRESAPKPGAEVAKPTGKSSKVKAPGKPKAKPAAKAKTKPTKAKKKR